MLSTNSCCPVTIEVVVNPNVPAVMFKFARPVFAEEAESEKGLVELIITPVLVVTVN
jgi:hypothetical protein